MTRPQPIMRHARPDLIDRALPRGTRPPEPLPMPVTAYGDALAALLGIEGASTGVYPTERTIGGLPALDRGVQLVSNSVAAMMVKAKVLDADEQPIDIPNIVRRPFSLMYSFEWWAMVTRCAMMRGNFVGILADFDADGYARQVVPTHPDAVDCDTTSGFPVYRIGGETYEWEEVVHVRANAPAGTLWGEGILDKFKRALETQLFQMRFQNTSYKSGNLPTAVVQLDKPKVEETEAEAVQNRFVERFGNGNRLPIVTGKALSIASLSWTPEQAEFVESLKLSVAACAHICGLRPEDLGAAIGGNALSYGNRSDDALQRITDSYGPWLHAVEQPWSDLVPGGATVVGEVEALLRMSPKERLEFRKLAQEIGIETSDESRELEHRPKAPKPKPSELPPPPPPAPANGPNSQTPPSPEVQP